MARDECIPLPYHFDTLRSLFEAENNQQDAIESAPLFRRIFSRFCSIWKPWKPSNERKHVESLLNSRKIAPATYWDNSTVDWVAAEPFLRALAQFMEWPNCHFLPNDPIASAFLPCVNEFANEEFMNSVRRISRVPVKDSMLRDLIESEKTIYDLIRSLSQDLTESPSV